MNREPSLHVVSDSISMHYGVYLERLLDGVMRYSRKPPQNNDPESANGRDSDLVLDYLRSIQHSLQPDYLMINCGLHDIKRIPRSETTQVPLERYAQNLKTIIAIAHEMKANTIWVRTTPVVDHIHNSRSTEFSRHAKDVAAFNAQADSIMAQYGVEVIDLFTFTQAFGEDAYCDHVHFTETVRAEQAAFIVEQLKYLTGKHPERSAA